MTKPGRTDIFDELFLTIDEEKRYKLERLAKSFIKNTRHECREALRRMSRDWTIDAAKFKDQNAALTEKVCQLQERLRDAEKMRDRNAIKLHGYDKLKAEKEKLIEENEKLKDSWDCSPVIQDYVAAIEGKVKKLKLDQEEYRRRDKDIWKDWHIAKEEAYEKVLAIIDKFKEGKT